MVGGLALLIVALIVFFVLVGRLLDLMRPRRVVARVVQRGGGAIREAYPFPVGAATAVGGDAGDGGDPPPGPAPGVHRRSTGAGSCGSPMPPT